MIKKMHGVTILEAILVLLVASSLLVVSIRQYQNYQRYANLNQVKANVDAIFQAMYYYFQTHCNEAPTATEPAKSPLGGYYFYQYLPVSVQDLVNEGFLSVRIHANPIVDRKEGVLSAYAAQFNQYHETQLAGIPLPDKAVQVWSPTEGKLVETSLGKLVIWRPQVAVKLADPNQASLYQGLLGGDCSSSETANASWGEKVVLPCKSKVPGPYIVWNASPVYASSRAQYMTSNPVVRQFKQMYTTLPTMFLTNIGQTTGETGENAPIYQYYTCGSGR